MKKFKNISIVVIVLMVALVTSNWIYSKFIYPTEILGRPNFLHQEFSQLKNADAVWMSASLEFSAAPDDSIKTVFSEILGNCLGEKIVPFSKPAFNAKDFYQIIQQQPELFQGKRLYVSMNMRTFGMKWQVKRINKENSFNTLFYNDKPKIINRLRASLGAHIDTPDDEFQWQVEYERIKRLKPENQYIDRKHWLKELKIKYPADDVYWWRRENLEKFAFNINESNRMLSYFNQLTNLCEELNIQLVYVILPEDLELLKEVYGQEIIDVTAYNNQFLLEHFSKTKVINLYNFLESDNFYEDFITEHYNFEGKRKIAQKIKEELN